MEEILKEIYKVSPYLRFKNLTDFDEGEVGFPIYGEITMKGVDLLVKKFITHFNDETVFFDLGSGLGKMVSHIGLKYKVKKSVGIEYSKERYNGSLHIKEKFFPTENNIIFINDNFMDTDISDATVIYIDNLVMSIPIINKLVNILPKGCLIICRRKPTVFEFKGVDDDKFLTTYHNTKIFHLIKE